MREGESGLTIPTYLFETIFGLLSYVSPECITLSTELLEIEFQKNIKELTLLHLQKNFVRLIQSFKRGSPKKSKQHDGLNDLTEKIPIQHL